LPGNRFERRIHNRGSPQCHLRARFTRRLASANNGTLDEYGPTDYQVIELAPGGKLALDLVMNEKSRTSC
jgi:hypothetical protein